jgi:hypothetical protein
MKHSIFIALFTIYSFNGATQTLPLPYASGFDNAAEQAGWQQYRLGNDADASSWTIAGGGFSAPNALSHGYNVGGDNGDTVVDWFVSPELDFSTQAIISLKVKTNGFSTPTPEKCQVWFATQSPDPSSSNFVLIGTLSFMSPQFEWLDTTLKIPFTSSSGYIAFSYTTVGAEWMAYAIDNVIVEMDPEAMIDEEGLNTVGWNVYPNPSTSEVSILGPEFEEIKSLTIYDALGRQQIIERIDKQRINVSKLNAGQYWLMITTNSGTIGKELIID